MQRLGSCHEELVQGGMRDDPLSEVPLDLQLAALRCITAGLVMHGISSNPEMPIRAALFMDDAIQRHARYALEIKACQAQALPDLAGFRLEGWGPDFPRTTAHPRECPWLSMPI